MISQSEAVPKRKSFLTSLAVVLSALAIFLLLSYFSRNVAVRAIENHFYEATLEVCMFSVLHLVMTLQHIMHLRFYRCALEALKFLRSFL